MKYRTKETIRQVIMFALSLAGALITGFMVISQKGDLHAGLILLAVLWVALIVHTIRMLLSARV